MAGTTVLQRTLDCTKKTSTYPNRRERHLIRKTTERERERQMDRKREKEGGRMECFMKKEDKSLIEVENVVKYRRKVLPSELTNTIEQFMVYVHRNEAYFIYIYVYQCI